MRRDYSMLMMAASLGMFAAGPDVLVQTTDLDPPAPPPVQPVRKAAAAPHRLPDPRHVPAEKSGGLQRLLAQKGRK